MSLKNRSARGDGDSRGSALHPRDAGTPRSTPGFSASIDLKRIERESRRFLALGFVFAILFHAGLSLFLVSRRPATRPAVHETPRRILRADIIEVPRIPREPLRITEHRFDRKPLRRPGFSPPIPGHGFAATPLPLPDMKPPEFRQDLTPELSQPPERFDGALILDGAVPRAPDTRIPLRRDASEDPGMFRADIIYNPADKFAAQGFVHIPLIRSGGFTQTELYIHSLRGLVEGINRHTNITAVLDAPYERIRWQFRKIGVSLIKEEPSERGICIDSLLAYHPPLVYILADRSFRLNEAERESLRRYLDTSGVLVIESAKPGNEELRGELRSCMKSLLAFEADNRRLFNNIVVPAFEPVPPDHPIFHCFFDFYETPDGAGSEHGAVPHRVLPYLEGIWLRGRLIAVYSDRGYGLCWGADGNYSEQVKMGINLVVYALVQQRERPGHRAVAAE